MDIGSPTVLLPVKRDITRAYASSLAVALLMAGVSLAGLLYKDGLYPTAELQRTFVSNDVVNLFIGLPLLLGSAWLARRGRLIGLLCWPGALFYVLYNTIAYAVAMPFTTQFAVYLALIAVSLYAMFELLTNLDSTVIQQRLAGAVPERVAGGVLLGLGTLFFARGISQVAGALSSQSALAGPESAVLVADLLTTPAWIVGGFLLWRRQPSGYILGAGLLFQASMLFVGLLVFFVLQPFLTATPFPLADFVVIFVMGLVCFIPFGLFVRGILSN